MNRQRVWKAIGAVLLACGLQLCGQQADADGAEKPATFILFEVPGSTCMVAFSQCTMVRGINPEGAVTGSYADATGAIHSFLRASNRNGNFITFDPPGSTCTVPSIPFAICSYPGGINPAGAIAGTYCSANTCHGFLRSPDGRFTTFDAPGVAVNGPGVELGTVPNGINPAGAITGYYVDANYMNHGFLRSPDGRFTTFDAPGAVPPGGGTVPSGINPAGAIIGLYYDASGVAHSFLRAPDGRFTTFDPTGCPTSSPSAINPAGTITGWCYASEVTHGFLRSPDGRFTTFDAPGSMFQNAPLRH
jgi:hypothetical protein